MSVNKESNYVLQHTSVWRINKTDSFGFTNVASYLDAILMNLNGRCVFLEVTPIKITISDDLIQEVPELRRDVTIEGNDIDLEYATVVNRCKIGEGAETCIFLLLGREGFSCGKFNHSLARNLLNRAKNETMNARRIGNCRLTHAYSGEAVPYV